MFSIGTCPIPDDALLMRYAVDSGFADCYTTVIDGAFSQAQFVEAFYTTWLFKLERAIIHRFIAKPSTDDQARQLANGSIDSFAAWHVEARSFKQLLLCDFQSRTRSWLMVAPIVSDAGRKRTRLYFGSAVVPVLNVKTGTRSLGLVFVALLGFHRLYSRVLLYSTRSRLQKFAPAVRG